MVGELGGPLTSCKGPRVEGHRQRSRESQLASLGMELMLTGFLYSARYRTHGVISIFLQVFIDEARRWSGTSLTFHWNWQRPRFKTRPGHARVNLLSPQSGPPRSSEMPLSPPCTAQAVMHFPQVTPFTEWAPEVSPLLLLVSLWSLHTFLFSSVSSSESSPWCYTREGSKNSQAHPCAIKVSRNAHLSGFF